MNKKNTGFRFSKTNRKVISWLVIIPVLVFGLGFLTEKNQKISAHNKEDSGITEDVLSDQEKIELLKQTDEYESLTEAFRAIRKTNANSDSEKNEESLYTQTAKLFAADGASNDRFGVSVAISGHTAIVGVFLDDNETTADQGSAYVFVKSGGGWSQQAKLLAHDGAAGDQFGASIAIEGDTAIIGALGDNVGASNNQGSAYVFTRVGNAWTQQQKLTADDGAAGDEFGNTIAITGDTVIIGANADDIGTNTDQGSAYVFKRTGNAWIQQQKLTVADGAAGDRLGASVGISGTTAVVGAFGDNINANTNQGSAYVFSETNLTWTQQAKLIADDGAAGDEFGFSAAISGNSVIVSALGDGIGVNSGQGSAYIFTRNDSQWTQQQKLTANDGADLDNFGLGVAISANTAVVGAWLDDVGTYGDQGSAYIFTRSGTIWSQEAKLITGDGAETDYFGNSTAISGNTIIVGAYGDNFGSNSKQGSAYIFENSIRAASAPFDFDGDGKTDVGVWRAPSGSWWYLQSSDLTGHGHSFGLPDDIITPGDFTGDGKTDVAIWRPSTGEWFVRRSEDSSYFAYSFGLPGDIPATADYDGDSITDTATFRPSTATWYIFNSASGTYSILTFGLDGDKPVPADFDGDGKADIAVWRPSNGTWWIVRSSNLEQRGYGFGLGTDKPVVGDYTGDGKADIAVWRDSSREWFFLRSEDGSYYSYASGLSGDIPAPGDYDDDGRFDSAVFRPSTQTWYIDGSSAGSMIATFGLNGDRPVANAFVP